MKLKEVIIPGTILFEYQQKYGRKEGVISLLKDFEIEGKLMWIAGFDLYVAYVKKIPDKYRDTVIFYKDWYKENYGIWYDKTFKE